ncbi:MAG: DUF5131 family protein [Anaerolineaceae bacterium]|nr:DUF5131 family protein [Anaerolineaceae bacterium]
MNRQRPPSGIEWTRVSGRDGYTWNPTGGCLHGCTWKMPDGSVTECYAKTIAERFTSSYPHGFEHHYWRPHALEAPLKLKKPAGIFVGSMADLFGHWVPTEQIREVLDVMDRASWHIFQTLSKYPLRLPEFNSFPQNVWVGVSVPAGQQMPSRGAARALLAYLRHMEKIEATVRFMSIEPLWFDVVPVLEKWLSQHGNLPFEWAIIGAATNGRRVFQPKEEWTANLVDLLDAQGIPLFFKGNLDWADWREDFPEIRKLPIHQVKGSFL